MPLLRKLWNWKNLVIIIQYRSLSDQPYLSYRLLIISTTVSLLSPYIICQRLSCHGDVQSDISQFINKLISYICPTVRSFWALFRLARCCGAPLDLAGLVKRSLVGPARIGKDWRVDLESTKIRHFRAIGQILDLQPYKGIEIGSLK